MNNETAFLHWLFRVNNKTFFIKVIVSIITITASIVSLYSGIRSIINEGTSNYNLNATDVANTSLISICVFNLLVILYAFFRPLTSRISAKTIECKIENSFEDYSFNSKEEFRDSHKTAVSSIGVFNQYWLAMWGSWFFIYLLFIVEDLLFDKTHDEKVSDLVRIYILPYLTNLIGHFGNLMAFFCYGLFSNAYKPNTQDGQSNFKAFSFVLFLGVISLDLVARVICYLHFSPQDAATVDLVSKIICGLSGAVALALFTGKLDNSLLNVNAILLSILFFYSALQALYPIIDGAFLRFVSKDIMVHQQVMKFIILFLALTFKLFFLMIIRWLNGTNRLYFYFLFAERTRNYLEKNWSNFNRHLVQ